MSLRKIPGFKILLFVVLFASLFFIQLGGAPHASAQTGNDEVLRVVTYIEAPWVMKNGDMIYGFHADLWNEIAKTAGLKYEYIVVDEWAKMLQMIEAGQADVAVEHHGVNADRETKMDFTHQIFEDGIQVVVSQDHLPVLSLLRGFASPQILQIIGFGLLILLFIAHLVWLSERSQPDSEFPKSYFAGIRYALTWAILTIISQEGIISKNRFGRLVSALWFFFILFALSAFTAQLATAFTVAQLNSSYKGIDDLKDKRVATWPNGKQIKYLQEHGIKPKTSDHTDELIQWLKAGEVDALVLDTGNALYFTKADPSLLLVGGVVKPGSVAYPIVQDRTDLVEKINRALLKVRESGTYDIIYTRYFGAPPGGAQ